MIEGGVMAAVQRVGHAVWSERRLFEALGSWVRSIDDPTAKVAVATQSRHHAWRAEQLADLLSTFGGTDAARLAVAADGSLDAALAACAGEPTPARLRAVHAICGELVAGYEAMLADASPVADSPAIRVLGIVAEDLRRDRRSLGALLGDE